jgi:hypothetical protein
MVAGPMPRRFTHTVESVLSSVATALSGPDLASVESPMRMYLLRFVFPVLLVLPGCHLIDQTDFEPARPAAAAAHVPEPETRPALVTIDYKIPDPQYRAPLAAAIQAVETRRPGSLYDVVGVIGSAADAHTASLRAADVMTAIEADGVIPARIQLGLMLEPGRKVGQVRIYLR